MAIRLLSVDVDGTITNGRNQVTQATADALRRAAAAGVIVTLNTGRNLCESQMVLDRVPEIRYLMGCTGAFLMDVQQHERLSNHTLDIVTARQVNAIFRKYDTLIGIFYDDLVCNQADEIGQFTRFYPAEMKSVFDTHTVVPSLTATLAAREGGVDKFYVVFADAAAQQAWKAQAVAIHSYLEYHKKYGSSANALVYTPVDRIPSSARSAIRRAVSEVKDEVLTCNGSVIDAVWSASAGYNTQTGVYGTCSGLDAWGTDVPYLQSVESPYEEQYHNLLRRSIGKDYTYVEYNDSRTGEPYTDADTTHKSLGGYVQYNTFVSNGRSYRYIGQFVSSRYCFDFGTDENGIPCMTYYGFGHGVGMSQCGAVGYAAERNMGYKAILRHYYKGASITSQGSSGGLFGWLRSLFG